MIAAECFAAIWGMIGALTVRSLRRHRLGGQPAFRS
jgi:hypothetical protein